MNAEVKNPDLVTITVDGVEMQVPKGSMIIEASDAANIRVPRFCYHKKLSIAANCRMCLVEVERAPKPLPACATPVAEGMKVFTKSPKALAAQKGVMEFLLINHPLDCPICDQGGECELQDVSFGYGRGVSRFTERKRTVDDENLGPLIATDMTRCIHCTRCVRFLGEVAGQKELGGMGRGEHTKISTYIEHGVHSELSGNIIDVCPVGALTSKPYRFGARAWELLSRPTIAPHDSVGSNVTAHYLRGQVKRVVPRDNEEINECWLSDRDRFSYQGIYSDDRLRKPMVKRDGQWQEVDWEQALAAAIEGLRKHQGDALGALVSPTATLEEMYLLGKLVRALGSRNIDSRLRQADFADDASAPLYPYLGMPIAALEGLKSALVIGSNTRSELPIINHRLRKASLRGAEITFLNPRRFDLNYRAEQVVVGAQDWVRELALVAQALVEATGAEAPAGLADLCGGAQVSEAQRALAKRLLEGKPAAVLVGALVESDVNGSALRALAALVAHLSGASFGLLPQAGNSVGAWIAGAVPQRAVGGAAEAQPGLNARAMLEQPRKAYVLFGLEPELDCWDSAAAAKAVDGAEFVVAMTPFITERMKQYADVLLPIGTFSETSGTFVNLEGRWQSFGGVAAPVGEARPGWRVLRVLGTLMDLDGFEFDTSEQVLADLRKLVGELPAVSVPAWRRPAVQPVGAKLVRTGGVPIYGGDALVRRAKALQETSHAKPAAAYLSAADAAALGVQDGDRVRVRQAGEAVLPVVVDDDVPAGTVWVPAATTETVGLGPMMGEITVARA